MSTEDIKLFYLKPMLSIRSVQEGNKITARDCLKGEFIININRNMYILDDIIGYFQSKNILIPEYKKYLIREEGNHYQYKFITKDEYATITLFYYCKDMGAKAWWKGDSTWLQKNILNTMFLKFKVLEELKKCKKN